MGGPGGRRLEDDEEEGKDDEHEELEVKISQLKGLLL